MNDVLVNNMDLFVKHDFFSKKLIDNIPGIFYVYKQVGQKFLLFAFNKQHEKITGFDAEEALNKEPYFFVQDKDHEAITEALEFIQIRNHVKQVYGSIVTKEGDVIPHVFEGYRFEYKSEMYFMGLGTDISDLSKAHEDLKRERLERGRKEKELLTLTLKDKQKEAVLTSISKKLDALKQNAKDKDVLKAVSKLSEEINSTFIFSEDNWQKFEFLFNNLHETFYENLLGKHPDLTKSEQNYCGLIKLKMSTEQICTTLNISKEGLKKKKYRLKQKMNLDKALRLECYIGKF
ncbi:hypothetical protein BN863_6740 [Formosa agariphila KMM 3901]|uniref:PAS domain-containing protein n=1 Tax=Formosa agariphila (strain DSM 15362 / KCTC 12365 / LMG 23005 / KMM 3901 / M-2Alg 35-1) TaxID=1347342 RepID=T2KIZ8_FORAG|nr:PAS domain S-box protein [Formosa agariphila]CDF78386.1 hypothetical protein BN863_6740 [Formosa agariphila KMM 3901]